QGLPPSIKDGNTLNPDVLAETTNTSGTYKNVAYFTQDNYVDLDANGYVFEWERYEDVKDDSANFDNVVFFLDNASSNPDLRWHPLDTYDQAQSMYLVNGEYINSTVFSPEFDVDTYIRGKAYFMCAGETWRSVYSEWTLRVTLERFNPSTGQADYITEASGEFDDTNEYTGSYYNSSSSAYQGMIYEANIQSNTLIPAGYRLRATYEAMLSSASYANDSERFELRSGASGGSTFYRTQWDIDDGNDTYDNFYHIENGYESLGVQFYMYQENYPTIDLTGLTNNTIYADSTNGTLSTSADSTLNKYKWDSDSFTSFNSPTIISLPETTAWHTLTVQAYDFFENLAEATYSIGFDESGTNIILHTPANNSLVADAVFFNFSIYDSTSVFYEWDKNGTQFALADPFDLYGPAGFVGSHQLTIHYTDAFSTTLYEYFFIFDGAPPDILLVNVVNETTQPQGKNIDVIIDDQSYPIDVQYKWDSDSFTSWSPFLGNLYRAYLPSTAGWHNLSVFANDTYGNSITKVFSFNTSLSLLNVELYNLLNNSYYQGGNTVQISITNDNGTVKYFWGNDPWSDGTVISGIMTLSGGDALSSTPGTYMLTVIVGNADHDQVESHFLFMVDQENPTIVQTIPVPDYNDSRFLDSAVLSFTIDDNWTDTADLTIYYSIDKGNNLTLESPFSVYLSGLSDGLHNLTIVVYDIAGNYYRYYITFNIDTTRPDTSVTITGQALVDGFRYIPADTLVSIIITDADPITDSYYRWNSSTYVPFTDSFTLPAIEGYAKLDILANDTLGNYRVRTYWLTIDDSAPSIELIFLLNHTKINDITPINFNVEDINDNTIAYIESQWDIEGSPSIRSPDFNVSLLIGHLGQTDATIYLYTYDVVGNDYSCEFHFILDFVAPTCNLISTTNNSYLLGGELIDFDVPEVDINKFLYKWDDDEAYLTVTDPWDILAPLQDGNHTLNIRLEDDTGMELYPNFLEATFVFIIDDIDLIYMNPSDFSTDYYYTMYYGDEFNFSINIRDRVSQKEIVPLNVDIIKENTVINLVVSNTTFNTTVYNFTIHASNITNGAYTYIDFEFYQFESNKQIVRVNIKVHRKEGNVLILDAPESIIFENDVSVLIQLRDDTNTTGQALLTDNTIIDGRTTDFTCVLIDGINYIYNVTFSSNTFFIGKGQTSFTIYIESNFYYGVRNDTASMDITILPIPITLSINVENVEVPYGSDLVVSCEFLRTDSTPVRDATVTFMFEIHYQNGTVIYYNDTTSTDLNGLADATLLVTEDMDYISVIVVYEAKDSLGIYYDPISDIFGENIYAVSAGLTLQTILIIVGASVLFSIVMGFVIYRVARARPFEELMEKVSEEDIEKNMEKISPGVILSIFDQKKGPIPLIGNHSLESSFYKPRMRIGYENFLLKISDQAYSSLGFEEHDDRRRIGSLNLPNEDMIGFIHGVQLPNPAMRGGFENLTLIVLADKEEGGLMLANQEFMFIEIDELITSLQGRAPLGAIEEHLKTIRRRSVIIMLAAQKNAKKDKKETKKYQ
ncbi:MAG: hypothetical protein KGD59_06030, partial [Candidatus Heimdallarchaeota archaeon]|nr:hypothetical protein [Candidatus Heimdallarchaeota archaeon]